MINSITILSLTAFLNRSSPDTQVSFGERANATQALCNQNPDWLSNMPKFSGTIRSMII